MIKVNATFLLRDKLKENVNTIKLSDINLLSIGNTLQVSGLILSGENKNIIFILPDSVEEGSETIALPLTLEEWTTVLRQMDIVETQMITSDSTGIVKKIVRKTQRQIDARLKWDCFHRDGYTCRYCGKRSIPLTVDHVDLWEDGGVTIKDNLITSCKKCNKKRGRMKYEEWIISPEYIEVSKGLDDIEKKKNLAVLKLLPQIRAVRVQHIRSR